VRARLVGLRCHVRDLVRTLSLDLDVALGPRTSSDGVAPEAAYPGAVRPGASTSDWCLARRRNCVSPSRVDEVKDGRTPPLAARAQRRVLDVAGHSGSRVMARVQES
jgi:hypothetical protein